MHSEEAPSMSAKFHICVTREVRLRWSSEVRHDDRGVFRNGGVWYADAPEIWKGLRLIVLSENFMHGENTHWIETRAVNPQQ
ncbi:hypothetical protein [Variovorax sp. N23]|uniref:hypothetical protein n=1 Tax=Variovorax sp. N23 TaxID=2980555 RepID=UPI0021C6A62F|nr:hypothetical protein [Variovorax sp. N23]